MENKELTEEDFAYTPEEQKKIELLRNNKKKEIDYKKNSVKYSNEPYLKKDTPVFIHIDGTQFTGYILDVIKEKKTGITTYTVNSGHGVLKGIKSNQISKRTITDLSHITIPEELKTMSAYGLLKLLKSARLSGWYFGWDGWQRIEGKYSVEELKAALKDKPHVPTKREKKVVQKYK